MKKKKRVSGIGKRRKSSKRGRCVRGASVGKFNTEGVLDFALEGASTAGGFVVANGIGKFAQEKMPKPLNRGLLGAIKVAVSHIVAPMLLPKRMMDNRKVRAGLNGFGANGLTDIFVEVGDMAKGDGDNIATKFFGLAGVGEGMNRDTVGSYNESSSSPMNIK